MRSTKIGNKRCSEGHDGHYERNNLTQKQYIQYPQQGFLVPPSSDVHGVRNPNKLPKTQMGKACIGLAL